MSEEKNNGKPQKNSDIIVNGEKLTLSNDFEVLLTIYEQTVLNGEKITEKDLKELLKEKKWPKNQVSKSISRMYDRGMIDGKWAYVKPQTWGYCIFVDERFLEFTTGLYNATQTVEKKEERKQVVDEIKSRAAVKKTDEKETYKQEIKKTEKENEFK